MPIRANNLREVIERAEWNSLAKFATQTFVR